MEPINQSLAKYWSDFLVREFKNETDRAAVILATSLIENALTALIKSYLAPTSSQNDELLDGAYAPLSNFNSKIQITHRLGLISQHLTSDLHLIRKLRNEFAHEIQGSNLSIGTAKNYLALLVSSSNITINKPLLQPMPFPSSDRGDFLMAIHIILWSLYAKIDEIQKKRIQTCPEEWLYSFKFIPPTTTPQVSNTSTPVETTQTPPKI